MGNKAIDPSEDLALARREAVMAVSAFCAAAMQRERLERRKPKITVKTAEAVARSDEGALAMLALGKAVSSNDAGKLRALASRWLAAARTQLARCRDAKTELERDAAVSVEEAWERARH